MGSKHRTTSTFFLLACIVIVQLATPSLGPVRVHASDLAFSPVLNVSNDLLSSDFPRIASAGSNVYLTWQNSTATSNTDILFAASNDNGSSFKPATKLSKSIASGNGDNQVVAAIANFVYVAWQDNTTADVWFSASSNGGQSFGTPLDLSGNSGSKTATSPQIVAAGNNVYVAWQNDVAGGGTDVLFSASGNNGQTFAVSKLNLSNDKASILPVIAAVGSVVCVAWRDNASPFHHDLILRTSVNNGQAFSTAQNLSNNAATPITNAVSPELIMTGSNAYAVWTRDLSTGPDDTFLVASTNTGTSFNTPVQLTTNGNSINPQVAPSGNNVHVIWEDHSTNGMTLVSYVVSSNNGATFGPVMSLASSSSNGSPNPQIVVSGSNVYAAWQDQSSANNFFLKSSSDSGVSFGSATNLSGDSNGFGGLTPALAANGNKVYVAWQDDSGLARGPSPDILFRSNAKPNAMLFALQSGWNSTLPPGTVTLCSPSGTRGCNPTLQATKDKLFVIQIVWKDSPQQNIAIYTNGTTPANVHPSDSCSISNTIGCLAKSQIVSASSTTATLSITLAFPPNFTPTAPYFEYYSQYNATGMHGRIEVHRNLDVDADNNGRVDIVDIATIAFAYGSTPGKPSWNIAADLDNSGKIDILDIAFEAFYFGQSI